MRRDSLYTAEEPSETWNPGMWEQTGPVKLPLVEGEFGSLLEALPFSGYLNAPDDHYGFFDFDPNLCVNTEDIVETAQNTLRQGGTVDERLGDSTIQLAQDGTQETDRSAGNVDAAADLAAAADPPPVASPAVQRKESASRVIDPEEWERVFPVISSMYASNTLAQIMKTLATPQYFFEASRKQYKTRLSQWQAQGKLPTKNIRRADMQLMVQLEHKRMDEEQKKTLFTYHGFAVEGEKIERFKKKDKKLSISVPISQDIPAYIQCTTPVEEVERIVERIPPITPIHGVQSPFALSIHPISHDIPGSDLPPHNQLGRHSPSNNTPIQSPASRNTPTYNTPTHGALSQSTPNRPAQFSPVSHFKPIQIRSSQVHSPSVEAPLRTLPIFTPSQTATMTSMASPTPLSPRVMSAYQSNNDDTLQSWGSMSAVGSHMSGMSRQSLKRIGTPPSEVSHYQQPSRQTRRGRRSISIPQRSLRQQPVEEPAMLKEPATTPIRLDQLIGEVRDIYKGLVMVENKAMSIGGDLCKPAEDGTYSKLSLEQLQALTALHQTLLKEHHDFLLASSHPIASEALRKLATKYSMPARMWKHGIHMYLEILRQRLPDTYETMLAFVYYAYQIMGLLLETVPDLEATWIECLGDLSRYRWAIEDEDQMTRRVWQDNARYWYQRALDGEPGTGRLHHHIAITKLDGMPKLGHYACCQTALRPFPPGRDSMVVSQIVSSCRSDVESSFATLHLSIFTGHEETKLQDSLAAYLGKLQFAFHSFQTKFDAFAPYSALVNITALFEYGFKGSALRKLFELRNSGDTQENLPAEGDELPVAVPGYSAEMTSRVFSETLTAFLRNVLRHSPAHESFRAHIHIKLAFIFALLRLDADSPSVRPVSDLWPLFPWQELCDFLNELVADSVSSTVNRQLQIFDPTKPAHGADDPPLPEDYLIRGQLWSADYPPEALFKRAREQDERSKETGGSAQQRQGRILWLAVQIAQRFAEVNAPRAEEIIPGFFGALSNRYLWFERSFPRFYVDGAELRGSRSREDPLSDVPMMDSDAIFPEALGSTISTRFRRRVTTKVFRGKSNVKAILERSE